jgi:hypothetical protein
LLRETPALAWQRSSSKVRSLQTEHEEIVKLTTLLAADPRTFVPSRNSRGEAHNWGVLPFAADEEIDLDDYMSTVARKRGAAMLYWSDDGSGWPEAQFIQVL